MYFNKAERKRKRKYMFIETLFIISVSLSDIALGRTQKHTESQEKNFHKKLQFRVPWKLNVSRVKQYPLPQKSSRLV